MHGRSTDKRKLRASGSQVDDLESFELRRNLEKSAGWANSVAQQSDLKRPLSPIVEIDPPKNVTQDRIDKRFNAYPKTTPLFQQGAGLFSAQLQDSSFPKKPEISKSIRVADVFVQDNVPATKTVSVPKQAEKTDSQAQLSQQIDGKPNPNNSELSYPTSNLTTEW